MNIAIALLNKSLLHQLILYYQSITLQVIRKMSCIMHLTVWKCHVNTDIDNVFKWNYDEQMPVWMVQGNDVAHWSTKHFMLLADALTGSWQWLKDSAKESSGTNRCSEEDLYLAIIERGTSFQSVGNCERVSSGNPFVLLWMKHCTSSLESCKEVNRR